MESYDTVTEGKTKGMSELSAWHVLSYGADDTIVTGHLFNFFEMIMDIEGTFDVYCEVEQLPMYMVAHAFVNGVDWDPDYMEQLAIKDKVEADKALDVINDYLTEMQWSGTVFEPLAELSTAEIKRGYEMLFGEPLKTRFRIVEKVAGVIEDTEFRGFILADDLDGLNSYIKDRWVPKPKFNPGSTKDKRELLYEVWSFPVRFNNQLTSAQKKIGQRVGSPTADEDAIKWMIKEDADEEQRKFLEALLRWTAYDTRNGLYYQPYQYLAHWKTGKLHPSLKQSWTTSRRFAPAGPNVNQQPKRTEAGKKIRGAIVPHHKDAVIVAPDFTGQELRIGAEVTEDENFLSCYIGDELKDLHTITAFEICQRQGREFGTYDDLAKALAQADPVADGYRTAKAKPTNFLSQYVSKGGGAWTLSKKLQITTEEAEAFLEAKSDAFPGVDEWKESYGAEVIRVGYAETLLGARKHVGRALAKDKGLRNYLLRSSLNFRIQSSAAEMTKLVMAEVWRQGLLDKYDSLFYFPVHDEVVFSVALEDLVAFTEDLWPIMTQPYADMEVPIISSLAVGPSFEKLDEIDWAPVEVERWIDEYELRRAA
jgi:DNA polymerase I-like protein with 3'-5' exonuclease and polymerase domains